MSQGFWDDAEIISVYTRADAIRDGELVDVSAIASMRGFLMPLAMTRKVWDTIVEWMPEDTKRAGHMLNTTDRLIYALDCVRLAISTHNRSGQNGQIVTVTLEYIPRGETAPTTATVNVDVGPGDDLEPVLTIMYPDED